MCYVLVLVLVLLKQRTDDRGLVCVCLTLTNGWSGFVFLYSIRKWQMGTICTPPGTSNFPKAPLQ